MKIFHCVHHVTHKHYRIVKHDVGVMSFCESRLPEVLGGRVKVAFQPDFTEARWWGVPDYTCADGETLLVKMIHAGNAFHAMSLLRGAYDATNAPEAGIYNGLHA